MNNDWYRLGDAQYRKVSIYPNLLWQKNDIKLDNFDKICGSSLGGPIALVKDESTITSQCKWNIQIFSSSGNLMGKVNVASSSHISGLGWNDLEELIIVFEEGQIRVYDVLGVEVPKSCHLGSVTGSAANPTVLKLLECHIWGDGLAAISWDMQVYVAEGLSSPGAAPKLYKLKTTLSAERPYTAMTVVPAQLATSGRLEVILATTDGSIIVLDKEGSQDQMLQTRLGSSVTKFALSANGLLIACYRRDGYLTVMTSSFTSRVLDFDTKTMSKPVDVVWCGDDAVLLLWRNTGIVMVGPKGDWLNFPYDGPLQLIPEADSCRILTNTSCEILQRLPQAIEVVRRIGSTDPAALLFDAMESFEKGEAKSDENIRSIAASNRLETAVTTCISAGAAEFEVRKQQGFLKAASYGKAFCSNLKPHDFVQTCQWLRILNDIRQPSIGMPMTFVQFKKLTPDALVKRLAIRNHHLLALKVCEILKLRSHFVLTHWASEKVRRMSETNASDEEICSALRRKLEVQKDVVSYLESAEMAISMKRKRLAKMLLELEKDPSEQIPLLLKMKEDETALAKAVASHDDDLTYMVLFHLDGSLLVEKQSFYRLLQPYPDALSLLRVYYQSRVLPSDKTLLNSYLLFNKSYTDAGVVAFNQSKAQLSIDLRIQCLKECVQLFSMGRGDASFLKASTEEQIELIDAQKMLETRAQRDFVGKSLSETLEQLVMLSIEQPHDDSWEREIVKLVKRFRMSEKSLWFTRLHCCARVGAWSSIAKLSNEKKSPIGYKPFASICIKYNRPVTETERYADKISESEDRCDVYSELQLWRKAFDVASKLKDPNRLLEIGNKCKDPQLEKQVQELLSRI